MFWLNRLTSAAFQIAVIARITERLDQLLAENNEIRDENAKLSNELQRIALVSTPSLSNNPELIFSYTNSYGVKTRWSSTI